MTMQRWWTATAGVLFGAIASVAAEAGSPPPVIGPVEARTAQIEQAPAPALPGDAGAEVGLLASDAVSQCAAGAAEPLDPPSTSSLVGAAPFAAGQHFKVDASGAAEVRISWLGATFLDRFAIKREVEPGDFTFQVQHLTRPASDFQVISALGRREETRLADLWCLLQRQPRGESGALLTSAAPNIFYVRDARGVVGAVDVIWGGAGWEIGASPLQQLPRWPAQARVISR
jgi:hypothetical protein